MTSPSKLNKDVITKVISFLSTWDLISIVKIDDDSIDRVKLIKSVASSKLFQKGKMLSVNLGSIPGIDLKEMGRFEGKDKKNDYVQAVICEVPTPKKLKKDWPSGTLCKVHLLHYKKYFKPGADETVSITTTEPKWLPCHCNIVIKCDICQDLKL